MDIEIVQIDPTDPAQRERIEQWAECRAVAARHSAGDYAVPFSVEEVISFAQEPSMDRRYWGALVEDRVVGSLVVVQPRLDGQSVGFIGVHVLPDHRDRGIGGALIALGEEQLRAGGRTQASGQTHFLPEPGDSSANFLVEQGYSPSLTMIQRDMPIRGGWRPLPVADGYEVDVVEGMPPAAWLDDLGMLMARMSTDAPVGDLDWGEEVWDGARYAESVQTQLDAGRRAFTAVAREVETGRLVAFTVAVISASTPHFAFQHETLVLREHRGHGLGRAVKEAVVGLLRESAPDVDFVRTWNADTNLPMVAVNEAMGYVAVAQETEWQKRL